MIVWVVMEPLLVLLRILECIKSVNQWISTWTNFVIACFLLQSVSAFAPICNPIDCPWGRKAFTGYLGTDTATWKVKYCCFGNMLILVFALLLTVKFSPSVCLSVFRELININFVFLTWLFVGYVVSLLHTVSCSNMMQLS